MTSIESLTMVCLMGLRRNTRKPNSVIVAIKQSEIRTGYLQNANCPLCGSWFCLKYLLEMSRTRRLARFRTKYIWLEICEKYMLPTLST